MVSKKALILEEDTGGSFVTEPEKIDVKKPRNVL